MHSEGIWYKPPSGEIGMCLRVGRMGPIISVDRLGQKNPDRSEGPWGRAADAVRTEVFQRAKSPGIERGSDEGSGEHEGRRQTDRREGCVAREGLV